MFCGVAEQVHDRVLAWRKKETHWTIPTIEVTMIVLTSLAVPGREGQREAAEVKSSNSLQSSSSWVVIPFPELGKGLIFVGFSRINFWKIRYIPSALFMCINLVCERSWRMKFFVMTSRFVLKELAAEEDMGKHVTVCVNFSSAVGSLYTPIWQSAVNFWLCVTFLGRIDFSHLYYDVLNVKLT